MFIWFHDEKSSSSSSAEDFESDKSCKKLDQLRNEETRNELLDEPTQSSDKREQMKWTH